MWGRKRRSLRNPRRRSAIAIAIAIANRDDASDEAAAQQVYEADGIFMTGGDQKRLIALTAAPASTRPCIAPCASAAPASGTSAGASVMSVHMLFDGSRDILPQKSLVHLAAGLGFVRRVVSDQHLSERQRLGRLPAIVAQNPYLLGAGIDENTALVIEPGHGIEIIGEGAVTLINGCEMLSNYLDAADKESLELFNVTLHLLPAGAHYRHDGGRTGASESRDDVGARPIPKTLVDLIGAVTATPDSGAQGRFQGAAS
ncbi:cyanophycinase [Methylibium sp.]|uniref:cyanophycinase n=1 Tax=Methylibium sp. TaxID=2067992 RepID=UPI0025DDEF3A|nr:cyanophycinase [Methylibium sp.]